MFLTTVLKPECIKVPLEGDKPSAIKQLVELLDKEHKLRDKGCALDAIFAREQVRSTGIGSDIAIPHGKCSAVSELTLAMGVSRKGIEYRSIDGSPAKIIILIVSPSDQTASHIEALAEISRLMLNDKFRNRIEEAHSAEQVYGLLASRERMRVTI